MSAEINLVVALPCEAKPLTNYFQLKKEDRSTLFPVYRNTSQRINLIVSGVGRVAAATAVSFMQTYLALNSCSSYLNVGIAGSGSFQLGEMVVAHKIMEPHQIKVFYPSISLLKGQCFASLLTVDRPSLDYSLASMMDMEGVGFFEAAQVFVDHERIHCLKIISDTSMQEMRNLNAKRVAELVQSQVSSIAAVVEQMAALPVWTMSASLSLEPFLQRWHFTVSEQHQLRDILRRWYVFFPKIDAFDLCIASRRAADVMQTLNAKMRQ